MSWTFFPYCLNLTNFRFFSFYEIFLQLAKFNFSVVVNSLFVLVQGLSKKANHELDMDCLFPQIGIVIIDEADWKLSFRFKSYNKLLGVLIYASALMDITSAHKTITSVFSAVRNGLAGALFG